MVGADPPLQSEATVHSTEAVKSPVPSAWTGARLVNPERPPAGVVGDVAMVVIVLPAKVSLNRKSSPPPPPVSTNLFPLISDTVKSTDVPDCVSVTEPNPGGGTLPPSHVLPEIWQLVRVKVSACAGGAATTSPTSTIPRVKSIHVFIWTSPHRELFPIDLA